MATLQMSEKERDREAVFKGVMRGELSVAQAGRALGLSDRQVRRLWKGYLERGAEALAHGLRGRVGNAGRGEIRARALALYRERYQGHGLGAAHAVELLGREGLEVSRFTLWRWLRRAGLLAGTRKAGKRRVRRERCVSVGELVQMDGSTHAWLGEGRPGCVLFVMIDDASSRVLARFYESEGTASAFDLLGRWARAYGLPRALYVDRDSIYVVNDAKAQEACRQRGTKGPRTQFGRAMEELGVRVIAAGSPQAKGRVERVHGTLQDRLVKELALEGVGDIAAANAYLEGGFLERLHKLIGVEPAGVVDLHRPMGEGLRLEEILCVRESRAVGKDYCVRYQNRILQIDKAHAGTSLAGRAVEVLALADGTLRLKRQGRTLAFTELDRAPVPARPARQTLGDRTPWRPGPDHPWKRGVEARLAAAGADGVKPAALRSASLRSPPFVQRA